MQQPFVPSLDKILLMSRICYRAKSLFSNGRFCPIKYSFIRVFNIPLENYTFPTPPTSLMSTWPQEFPIHKEKPASLDLNCFPKDRLTLDWYHNSVSHPGKKSCFVRIPFLSFEEDDFFSRAFQGIFTTSEKEQEIINFPTKFPPLLPN